MRFRSERPPPRAKNSHSRSEARARTRLRPQSCSDGSDQAFVILHHPIDGAQSQACAFADGLGGIERIEYAMRLFNARAAIGKLQHNLLAANLGTDPDQAAANVLHRVQRVLDNLDECLEQLAAIAPDFRQVGCEGGFGCELFDRAVAVRASARCVAAACRYPPWFFLRSLVARN